MKITEERLQSFIALYKEEFGISLTKSEAHQKASMVLGFVLSCIDPLEKIGEDDITGMPDLS